MRQQHLAGVPPAPLIIDIMTIVVVPVVLTIAVSGAKCHGSIWFCYILIIAIAMLVHKSLRQMGLDGTPEATMMNPLVILSQSDACLQRSLVSKFCLHKTYRSVPFFFHYSMFHCIWGSQHWQATPIIPVGLNPTSTSSLGRLQ